MISDEYFYRMLSPQALKLSAAYHQEESSVLEKCLKKNSTKNMNFAAIGGGELWRLRLALAYTKSYACIEPLADVFMNDSVKYLVEQSSNVLYIAKRFEDVTREDLPSRNNFFMFLFNVLAYINDPIEAINKLSKPGDILFISTWANTKESKRCRDGYFSYLNSCGEQAGMFSDRFNISDLKLADLKYFKSSERLSNNVADVLVIYL